MSAILLDVEQKLDSVIDNMDRGIISYDDMEVLRGCKISLRLFEQEHNISTGTIIDKINHILYIMGMFKIAQAEMELLV